MFTGIITAVGEVVAASDQDWGRRLTIRGPWRASEIDLGASIACAGTCLTVTETEAEGEACLFTVDAVSEALRLTTIADWQPGHALNLERSLKVGDELGGHMVTGHVDGKAVITAREEMGGSVRFDLTCPEAHARFVAQKGSVALDGTSLTVNEVEGNRFSVLLIPHTLAVTTWGAKKIGDALNFEVDLLARYAARLAKG